MAIGGRCGEPTGGSPDVRREDKVGATEGKATSTFSSERFSWEGTPVAPLVPPVCVAPKVPELELPSFSIVVSPIRPGEEKVPYVVTL